MQENEPAVPTATEKLPLCECRLNDAPWCDGVKYSIFTVMACPWDSGSDNPRTAE